jgi:hypothetical protein
VPRLFPSLGSAGRRFASLPRVLRGEFPCFHGTIKALRLPAARPAALRCLRLAVPRRPLVFFAPRRTSAPPGPGVGIPVSPAGTALRRRQDLPRSRGTPMVRLPCSVDAGRTAGTRPVKCRSVAPGMCKAEAPTKGLSTLHSRAFGLAVYASPGGLPRLDARLASSRWSGATGRASHPQGSNERFQSAYISSSFPELCVAQSHRPKHPSRPEGDPFQGKGYHSASGAAAGWLPVLPRWEDADAFWASQAGIDGSRMNSSIFHLNSAAWSKSIST